MRFLPVCAVFLTFGAVQAFAGAAEGKALYEAKCKKCHKADGSGMAAMKMRALGSAEVQAKSDADLKKDSIAASVRCRSKPSPTRSLRTWSPTSAR